MQKNYVITLFCFFISNNIIAQLPKDLARLTHALKNVEAKLHLVEIPQIIISTIFGDVEAPEGSTVTIKHNEITVHVPYTGGDVLLPSDGFLSSPGNWVRLSNGNIIKAPSTPGGVVIVDGGKKVKVFPKGSKVSIPLAPIRPGTSIPPTGIDVNVPANGIITLPNGEIIEVPVGSKVSIHSDGLYITVPSTGGSVKLSSSGGNIRVADMFNATLKLPDGTTRKITSNQTVQVPMEGIVEVISENTLPPVHRDVPFGTRKTIRVPGGSRVEFKSGLIIEAPKETIVRKLYDGLVVTVSPEGGDITTRYWGAYVGLPEGSPAVIIKLSDGREGEIVGGGYIIVPEGTTKIRPKFIEEKKFEVGKIKLPEE